MNKATLDYWNPKNETVVTETGFCYLNTTSVITGIEAHILIYILSFLLDK